MMIFRKLVCGLIVLLIVLIVWEALSGQWGWVLVHSIAVLANVAVHRMLRWAARQQAIEAYPLPPVNVKLVYPDGSTRPLDCLYVGRSDGVHNWNTILAEPIPPNTFLHCDVLPPHTALHSSWLVQPE